MSPEHVGLIQSVGIRIGLGDLLEHDIAALEWFHVDPWAEFIGEDDTTWYWYWYRFLARRALQTWAAKVVFVREHATIKHLRLQSAHGSLEYSGNLEKPLRGVRYEGGLRFDDDTVGSNVPAELDRFLIRSYRRISTVLRKRIDQDGWVSTRKWLVEGADGQM